MCIRDSLNTSYELYASILRTRTNAITETMLSEASNGFRKGRSCLDCIFTIAQLIEKRREYQLPTYIAFIDFEKAFDRVNRSKLWAVMARKGIPQHQIRAIQSLYVENKVLIEAGRPRTAPRVGLINCGCQLSLSLIHI